MPPAWTMVTGDWEAGGATPTAAPGYSGRAGCGAVGRPVGGLVRLSHSVEGPVADCTVVDWTAVECTAEPCTAVACTAVACTAVACAGAACTVVACSAVAAGSPLPPAPLAPAVTSGWVCW